MGEELDELFGETGGAPRPRRGLVLGLLVSGLVLGVLGLACSTVPGGLLVLASWIVVEKEMDRVETGYLPADTRADVRRLQQGVFAGLIIVFLLFLLQFVLLCAGVYDGLWSAGLQALHRALGLGGAPAP